MNSSKVKPLNQVSKGQTRVGVFICHCGKNIAGTVDIQKVVTEISNHPGVAYASDYTYMCSDPGQQLLEDEIKA